MDAQVKTLSIFKFSHSKGISPYTFQKYACKDKVKRGKVGVQDGRKAIVSTKNTDLLANIVVRAERANGGLARQESISTLQDLDPKLTRIQAQRYFNLTFFKKNAGKVKKRIVKLQLTSKTRNQITAAQQYQWFKKYQEGLDSLRKKNTRRCSNPGRHFGEVIQHFIIGGNKTCLIADTDGDVKIVGDTQKR